MKSIKLKILVPVFFMLIFFIGFMVIQFIYTNNNLKLVKEMNEKHFTTSSMADELKLDVVQVQQWLTDISATRAAEGFDDGFDNAEKYAQNIKSITQKLKKINPENIKDIESIEKSFNPYYETGKNMANAYINGGPQEGNLYMEDFDTTAELINDKVDKYKESSTKNISKSIKNIENSIKNTITIIMISIIISVIITILSWIFITKNIVNPITKILSKLKSMANNEGDLTQHIDFTSNDEIGELAKNFNLMQESFRNIVKVIVNESNIVEHKLKNTNKNIDELDYLIQDMFASTEKLSSGMEETAASTEEVSLITSKINSYLDAITTKAKNESENSFLITERANTLKNIAINSKEKAEKINVETQQKLLEAIEKSKEVEKINILSESVLQIASQTNLLSLNASIEAERAGEAGKGFAVVANQIKKLADDSKTTVSEIKTVNDMIINTVENLVNTSKEMVEFINSQVIQDYNMIVKTGEQYSNDANIINNMTTDFNETSNKMSISIGTVVESIKQINSANNESANGTNNISKKMNIISEKSNTMINLLEEVNDSTFKLVSTVSNFKI
ncbi:methyl-accepting chemotaxis protein [Clostridium weizhouense]|uniref:Methyl-accepting chemotaxis protein n=1 Tax=Clostridium weizhouense TaxID=2859781 RepID=A0ABS7AQ28_9CLOT|nr:methyl-accepting chemotaxis protein [Clostridium weizhouense]MBW6410766.1 methyl-accepting chemotaxis protein [Clostridium weizhouense]